jgi:tRNA(Ile)-lysidine synthase
VVAVVAGAAKMTIQTDFKRHLQEGRFFTSNELVVVAVSTGVDSMTLLDLLQSLPKEQRPRLLVAHVNHELRDQSKLEEQFIRNYCQKRGLRLAVAHWPRRQHPATGIEEAGRQFRYAFFARLMKKNGSKVLLTAHHADDLAETIMMKLTRGGQLAQLVGIADRRPFAGGQLVRPLLPFRKQELYDYATSRQLTWFEDATNRKLTVSRNRFRHQIIPALEKENPHFVDHLLDYREQLADLLAWRDQAVGNQLAKISVAGRLNLATLRSLPAVRQSILLRTWLERAGVRDLKSKQIRQLIGALANPHQPQRRLELPGNWSLVHDYDWCWLEKADKMRGQSQKAPAHVVKLGQRYPIDDQSNLVVTDEPLSETHLLPMWLAPTQLPLLLRPWRPGDQLLLKSGGHQAVRRVLIDQKVPLAQRERQLVLVDSQGTVVWLVGRKWSWFTRPADYKRTWRRLLIGIVKRRGEKHE